MPGEEVKMSKIHDEKEILLHLREKEIAVVSTKDAKENLLRSRVMYYGVDDRFVCYLMSLKRSPMVEQVNIEKGLSMLVCALEDPFDRSWEVEINGLAQTLTLQKEINNALLMLKGRNPFADVALEAGITAQFDFVKLTPKFVRYRIYSEVLDQIPPTIIRF